MCVVCLVVAGYAQKERLEIPVQEGRISIVPESQPFCMIKIMIDMPDIQRTDKWTQGGMDEFLFVLKSDCT